MPPDLALKGFSVVNEMPYELPFGLGKKDPQYCRPCIAGLQ